MNIVVLVGGLSREREISIATGCQIHNALVEAGHSVLVLDVYLGHHEEIDSFNNLFTQETVSQHKIPPTPPNLNEIKNQRAETPDGFFGKNVLNICKYADVVFLALHGAEGENGKIQATFDLLGINYTGTGYKGSLLALDKNLSKKIMRYDGVLTANWEMYHKDDLDLIKAPLDFPVVIKPFDEGSSIGVNVVNSADEFYKSIQEAFVLSDHIIVEEYIAGREFSVGILDSVAMPPIEIIPKNGFFDYSNKYQNDLTSEICPADLSIEQETELKNLALKVNKILGLESYSRIDFIYSNDGKFYCLEANSLPGMTQESLLPKESFVAGYTFKELCLKIVYASVNKKNKERNI